MDSILLGIKQLKGEGRSFREIAQLTGIPQSRVVNLYYGRVRPAKAQRRDAGTSRYASMDEALERVKQYYFNQSRLRGNISTCVDQAAREFPSIPAATLSRNAYVLARAERWDILWQSHKQQHGFQAYLPKLHYDYWPLIAYNDFWVIDGHKSDRGAWSDEYPRGFYPQGYYIMELRTGQYLSHAFKPRAFNSRDVILLLLQTALRYGPPNLGVLCDNGMEQIGRDNITVMESFWMDEMIQAYRAGHGIDRFHSIFSGAISPVVTSIPRIPTAFAKARLERSFSFLQRHQDALLGGTSYMGGGRDDVVHTTLMRSPKVDASWLHFDEFCAQANWFLTAPADDVREGVVPYLGIERPYMLSSFAAETGMPPTIGNAVAHCQANWIPNRIPDANLFKIAYHCCERFDHRSVRAVHQVLFTAHGRRFEFECPALDVSYVGRKVDVVLDPQDDTIAGIFADGAWIGVGEDYSRRIATGRITVAHGKEQMAQVRSHARAEVVAAAAPYVGESRRAAHRMKKHVPDTAPNPVAPLRIERTPSIESQFRLLDDCADEPDEVDTFLNAIYKED